MKEMKNNPLFCSLLKNKLNQGEENENIFACSRQNARGVGVYPMEQRHVGWNEPMKGIGNQKDETSRPKIMVLSQSNGTIMRLFQLPNLVK